MVPYFFSPVKEGTPIKIDNQGTTDLRDGTVKAQEVRGFCIVKPTTELIGSYEDRKKAADTVEGSVSPGSKACERIGRGVIFDRNEARQQVDINYKATPQAEAEHLGNITWEP